jgi:hypothetical protein
VIDCVFDNVDKADTLEGVRDLVLINVRVNGRARHERIARDAPPPSQGRSM